MAKSMLRIGIHDLACVLYTWEINGFIFQTYRNFRRDGLEFRYISVTGPLDKYELNK